MLTSHHTVLQGYILVPEYPYVDDRMIVHDVELGLLLNVIKGDLVYHRRVLSLNFVEYLHTKIYLKN